MDGLTFRSLSRWSAPWITGSALISQRLARTQKSTGYIFSLTTTSSTVCGRSRTHTLTVYGGFRRYAPRTFPRIRTSPGAVQTYNHYRKHWLGAYWQDHGITVIPTISWSDYSSFDWCFDGEPVGGMVAVSSVGTQNNPVTQELFITGYREMMDRLEPSTVIMYGNVPDDCYGNIVRVGAFQEKWRKTAKNI